jgi:hypothetical protein
VFGRKHLASIAAGFLTPVPLFLFLGVLRNAAAATSSPPLGWIPTIGASFLFALGIALWRPLDPVSYGASLAPSFAIWFYIFAGAGRSGNLVGLVLIGLFVSGACIGLAVALIGWLIRRRSVPRWMPVAPILAAFITIVVFSFRDSAAGSEGTAKIVTFLQQIRDAEQSYAAGRADHAYTCNGPDLPSIRGIEWRTDYNLGGPDRNQGEHDRFWVVLRCSPGEIRATASALWPSGPRFTFDSRTGVIAQDGPLR